LRFAEPNNDFLRVLTVQRSLQDSFGDDLANIVDYHEPINGTGPAGLCKIVHRFHDGKWRFEAIPETAVIQITYGI
jgi:hypothetical protein